MDIAWGHVLRDAVIVFVISFIGGFIAGFVGAMAGNPILTGTLLDILNPLFVLAAFVYVSRHAPAERWKHLILVAIGAWLISLVQIPFGFISAGGWTISLIPILVLMAIGGWLGTLSSQHPTPTS